MSLKGYTPFTDPDSPDRKALNAWGGRQLIGCGWLFLAVLFLQVGAPAIAKLIILLRDAVGFTWMVVIILTVIAIIVDITLLPILRWTLLPLLRWALLPILRWVVITLVPAKWSIWFEKVRRERKEEARFKRTNGRPWLDNAPKK